MESLSAQQLPVSDYRKLLLGLAGHSRIGFPRRRSPLKKEFSPQTRTAFGRAPRGGSKNPNSTPGFCSPPRLAGAGPWMKGLVARLFHVLCVPTARVGKRRGPFDDLMKGIGSTLTPYCNFVIPSPPSCWRTRNLSAYFEHHVHLESLWLLLRPRGRNSVIPSPPSCWRTRNLNAYLEHRVHIEPLWLLLRPRHEHGKFRDRCCVPPRSSAAA